MSLGSVTYLNEVSGPSSALAQAEPGLSGRDLVARMGISKQAVSQLVDTLVTIGVCRARQPSPDDRRRTLLQLTARGRERRSRVIDDTVADMEADMAAAIGLRATASAA